MFYKRLCDQWECEADDAIAELERQQGQRGNLRLGRSLQRESLSYIDFVQRVALGVTARQALIGVTAFQAKPAR